MRRFPGRTLEELDGMDYGRWMRALAAEQAETLERKRAAQSAGRGDLTADEWKRIQEHDRWLTAEYGSP